MYTVVLTIHLIIILALVAVVLIQRSEGGGLGIGGGGGNPLGGRAKANPLTTVTWALAAAFITTSIILTILAGQDARSRGVLDGLTSEEVQPDTGGIVLPGDLTGDALLPPTSDGEPLAPPTNE